MNTTHFPQIKLAALVLSVLAFAGCIGQDGQVEAKSIELAYDGNQSGSHTTTGTCDSEGTLTGSGSVTDGSVRIQVLDGSGNSRFEQTYTTAFTIESQHLSGASGSWKLSGARSGDDLMGDQFQGSYTITQRC